MVLLDQAGVHHAAVDLDQLNDLRPRPPDDFFQFALAIRNLSAVWANYQQAGAERLLVAAVVERRENIAAIGAAVPGSWVTTIRLRASVPALQARALKRDPASSWAQWHVDRAAVLAEQMERDALENHVVENEGRSLREVAAEVLQLAGWSR